MDFPIAELMDDELCEAWVVKYFHPGGLRCPHCQGAHEEVGGRYARTISSQIDEWRCKRCGKLYTIYSGTVFNRRHFQPSKVIMLLRGVCQGQSSASLARELGLSRSTVHHVRQHLQTNAVQMSPPTLPANPVVEVDEVFINAGEKR